MAQMKRNSSRRVAGAVASLVALYAVVAFVGCSSSSDSPPPAGQTKTIYRGTLYMASTSGGHVAVVPVTIDPSNAAAPITVGTLKRMQLRDSAGAQAGTGAGNMSHNFHDVRIDGNRLYYSTIMPDMDGNAHVGWVDLVTTTYHDAVIDAVPGGTGMVYCGSGRSATHFVPMTMSGAPYIDAIPLSSITNGATLSSAAETRRTYVSSFRGGNTNFAFAHGINNPGQTQLFVAVNETNGVSRIGSVTGYLLDMAEVEAGAVDPMNVTSRTIAGLGASSTIAFRSSYTPDGTKILQAGADRLLVLDAATLDPLDNNTTIGGAYAANGVENHDVMPTPDGKYAILALRFRYTNGGWMDSGLQLYDLTAKHTIGNPVTTCLTCHTGGAADDRNRATCGVDGTLTAVTVPQ